MWRFGEWRFRQFLSCGINKSDSLPRSPRDTLTSSCLTGRSLLALTEVERRSSYRRFAVHDYPYGPMKGLDLTMQILLLACAASER
jgi:hypothetical protein